MREAKRVSKEGQENQGIVYRVRCQQCGLWPCFRPADHAPTYSTIVGHHALPQCCCHGGMFRPCGRLDDKPFSSELNFRVIGIDPKLSSEDQDPLS